MNNRGFFGALSLIIIGVVFGAVLVSGFGWVKPSMAEVQIGKDNPPVKKVNLDAQAFNDAFIEVAESVSPSIVQIRVVTTGKSNMSDEFKFFFPFHNDAPRKQMGGGSGVIISEDGYILTNNHVVDDASTITVGLLDKREYDAVVVGTDPLTDLAVIKIDADNINPVYFGNSDNLKIGQWVMAIGNPLSLASTVTAGIISAKGRNLNLIRDSYGVENFIQTDAAINPGNSGGALVDLTGALIGINSAIATNGMTQSYIGYGFAIPINLAKAVAEDLIANGKVSRGYIGVSIEEVSSSTAKAVGLDKPQGVIIQRVVEGGAASEVDVQAGDIILTIDGREINLPNELQGYVASKRAYDEVTLEIFRDGEKIDRVVSLKPREDEGQEVAPVIIEKERKKETDLKEFNFEDIGLKVRNMADTELEKFDIEAGVIISSVEEYSKASKARLFTGLVIVEADRQAVESVSDIKEIIESKSGKAVLLNVIDKNGTNRFVGIEIPD